MTEIPELKEHIDFLKEIESQKKIWATFSSMDAKESGKERSNFLLHPKVLDSDSECSSVMTTPRNLSSGTVLREMKVEHELNNNAVNLKLHNLSQNNRRDFQNNFKVKMESDAKVRVTSGKLLKKTSKPRPATSYTESFDKKFKTMIEKCLKTLCNIRVMVEEGIPLPDGEEDFLRRTKRLQEFSARFSRVYLYPLLRQVDELTLPDKLGVAVIRQKLLYAQQLILQGLQAYYTHLPTSVGKCCSDKLKSLLDQVLQICHLYALFKMDAHSENQEFIDALRNHVELLLETLTTFDLKFSKKKDNVKGQNDALNKKNKVKDKSSSKNINQSRAMKTKPKLSMYTVNQSLKKESEYKMLTKKLSVKSRYKTASFKHRPPVQRLDLKLPSKMKLLKDSCVLLKTPVIKAAMREDDIKTMVEIDAELEAPPNTTENPNHENSIASSRQQLVQDNLGNYDAEEGNFDKAVQVLTKYFANSTEKQKAKFFEKIVDEANKENQDRDTKPKKKAKEPVVTGITGAKNAKLICIRDDNSVEEDKFCRMDKEIMTEAEIKVTSSETQTDLRPEKAIARSDVKISRLPKNHKKMLQVLPKDYAISIIQYKLRYSQFHKHNPIYRKSHHIQPWILMGRISDDILDNLLQSVTGELEVNEILENLYNAEFQY